MSAPETPHLQRPWRERELELIEASNRSLEQARAARARVRELEAALEAITGTLDAEVVPPGSVAERVRMLARMHGHAYTRGCERWDGWQQSRSLAADLAEAVRILVLDACPANWNDGDDPDLEAAWRRAAAALARYEQGAPADGWLPIESAPRPFVWFLAYEGGAVYAMSYSDDGTARPNCGQPVVRTPEPTHWRPLTPPPATAPTQQEGQ